MGKYLQTIVIKGSKYKIYRMRLEPGIAGLCDKYSKKIYLNETQKTSNEVISTLIHEMIHGLIHEVAIDQAIGVDMEEMVCENVSRLMCEYLDFFTQLKKKTRS